MKSPAPDTVTPKRSRRAKIIGAVIAIAAMAGLGWLAWDLTHPAAGQGAAGAQGGAGGPGGPGGGGGRRGGAPTTVGVATAELADIPVVLDALGTVTAAATTTVRPQVTGILQKVLFKEGQMVKAGQVLAQIDPRQFEMSLMQASGQRQRDEAQLENAKLTLERYRTLLSQDSIARQDVDTQAALVKQLEGTVMTDRASEGTARLNLGYTKVIAPISGRVGLRVVDVGNLVSSGDTAGIAVITQLSPIDVEFSVPQDRAPDVMAGVQAGEPLNAVALDRTRANALDTGRFSALDNQVDTQTGTIKAKARFANTKNTLFPSQFVNVRLELRTIKDAVMVPVTALRHGTKGDYVYVLKEDRTVSVRPVTRGQSTVDRTEIRTGLKAGEKVITEGADRLKDGAKVTLPGDKPAAGGGGRRGNRGGQGGGQAGADGASPPAGAAAGAAAPGASEPAGERRHRRDGAQPGADGQGGGERRHRREGGTERGQSGAPATPGTAQ
ncbi:MdtA/MuxA family multidrug efflux RND transporter periplasmic adaptor subunit [Pseudoduganella namucuonensis]|uniref:Membrane fusion protein, multidrug efflux system n=1 Tax=Pseudoduganella namucuonensis TaxID=1035707 RepID=A0A1I7JMD2_9BURK|nr:MdtA/MuxA family multidrug efflux RND transporter periplasmic adaptor subunit [Pseudoduganella namucuonensis]SFU86372.1 membrane fusion protein, multidrug efflux system [Pseudoduganella namucuonensis]